jgi:hypothetical protein
MQRLRHTETDMQIDGNKDTDKQKYRGTDIRRQKRTEMWRHGHTGTQPDTDTLEKKRCGGGNGSRTLADAVMLLGGAVAVNRSPSSARSSA